MSEVRAVGMRPPRRGGPPKSVGVVGGGLAGLACALTLARAGVAVTLFEQRRRLGGRATSFVDQQSGQTIDNCQHVALGCCDRYLALLEKLGKRDRIAWHDRQWWVEAGGRTSVLEPLAWHRALPGFASHAGSFLRASFLSIADKAAIATAMGQLTYVDRDAFVDVTFGEWLQQHQQPASAIERFWSPVIVSACNGEVSCVAASSAMHVFQDGLLAGARASRIGVPTVPLVELYDAAEVTLRDAGGELRLGETVEAISPTTVSTRTQDHEFRAVVCAVPFEKARKWLPASDPRVGQMARAEHSPILGVHLTFDRPVLATPHAVLVSCGTQWLFRKDDAGRVVHAVISAADAWMEMSEAQIVARVASDIAEWLPGSRGAQVVHARAVKERFATFLPTPGFERVRPSALPADARAGEAIVLAGDYTATDWPATMEGAVRSGERAAMAIGVR